MNRQEHRRRSRIRRRIGVGILAVAALGAGIMFGVVQDRSGTATPTPSASPSQDLVPLRTTVFSVASTADASRVLAIPPLLIAEPVTGGESTALMLDSAMHAVGPAGEAPLRQHASGFGPEGLAGAIRNELGLRIDTAVEITEVDLAKILERVGSIEISVLLPIVEDGEEVYSAGFHQMDATELVTFLAFPFADPKIDETTRNAMIAGAWKQIATAPATKAAVRDAGLAADATEALRAFATLTSVTAIPVQQLDDGIVLDDLVYEAMTASLERIWLNELRPQDRPKVDLRGQTLVEPMLLLIADGIRVARMTVEPVAELLIETDDQAFGARIEALLGGGTVEAPEEPLRTGLGARIAFPRAA